MSRMVRITATNTSYLYTSDGNGLNLLLNSGECQDVIEKAVRFSLAVLLEKGLCLGGALTPEINNALRSDAQ